MPGLSFVCDFKEDLQERQASILKSLDFMLHLDDYTRRVLLSDKSYFLASTQYKDYPVTDFEDDEFRIHLEGRIYGKDRTLIKDELNAVARSLFASVSRKSKDLVQWLLNTDGDFIVFILDKRSNSICFLNDALGRLPLYYSNMTDGFIASRELRFIKTLKDETKFDRMAIAQYLLFRFPLGTRTLLDNVYRLTPASLIRVDINHARTHVTRLHNFNFETKQDFVRAPEENARELIKLFSEACKTRAIAFNGKNILSLSGGFDSRSVAACLHNENIPFAAVTRLNQTKHSISDAKIAEQIARVLNIDLKTLSVTPRGKDLLQLLKIKSGMNYFGMAFIIPYLQQLRNDYGAEFCYFTGDGGGLVLHDLRPNLKIRDWNNLINYLANRNEIITVAALTRLSVDDIVDEIKHVLFSYPESDWYQKYVHFVIAERSFKWGFEGEDRNRSYFWSVTPFYSLKFFRYVMGCPAEQKKNLRLYKHFLFSLSPVVATIPHAHLKIPISGKQVAMYFFWRSIVDRVPRDVKKLLRSFSQRYGKSNHYACLQDQLNNCISLNEYVDCGFLKDIASRCDSDQIQNLLTITSVIEEFEANQSTLQKYHETEFL